ncbi:hypothetical protein BDQ17DRAFT_1438893 [Cyathus striatus]|nr:hypothetical protein BDQ17DRAFT_1438893 [Cyathus striatus]
MSDDHKESLKEAVSKIEHWLSLAEILQGGLYATEDQIQTLSPATSPCSSIHDYKHGPCPELAKDTILPVISYEEPNTSTPQSITTSPHTEQRIVTPHLNNRPPSRTSGAVEQLNDSNNALGFMSMYTSETRIIDVVDELENRETKQSAKRRRTDEQESESVGETQTPTKKLRVSPRKKTALAKTRNCGINPSPISIASVNLPSRNRAWNPVVVNPREYREAFPKDPAPKRKPRGYTRKANQNMTELSVTGMRSTDKRKTGAHVDFACELDVEDETESSQQEAQLNTKFGTKMVIISEKDTAAISVGSKVKGVM